MLHILFVDDEPCVLEALRDLLYHQRGVWEMHFVSGGDEALGKLAAGPINVVVSDVRMVGMSGVALLREVARRRPEITRIILSGSPYAHRPDLLKIAHSVLVKPCDLALLKEAIETTHGSR